MRGYNVDSVNHMFDKFFKHGSEERVTTKVIPNHYPAAKDFMETERKRELGKQLAPITNKGQL